MDGIVGSVTRSRWEVPYLTDYRRSVSHSEPGAAWIIPACIVLAGVLFNAVLAVVNGHVAQLTPAAVIGAEVLCVAAAHAMAIANFRERMTPWYALLLFIAIVALVRTVAYSAFNPRDLRDVLLIPTFVVLGMTFDERRLTPVIIVLQIVVLSFLLLEALDTPAFESFFRIEEYMINTRGWNAGDFWNGNSDLFLTATRPDQRYFPFFGLHRLSSIFLEPVSLGNYCTIIVAFICATYRRLGWATRVFLIGSTLVLIAGSDGRLAAASCAAVVALTIFVPRLPRGSALLYLPAATIIAFILVAYGGFRLGDNFPGRIAYMVELLRTFDLPEWLGVSGKPVQDAMDSGLAYLIRSQSLIGVVVIWGVVVVASSEDTVARTRFTHALALYMSLTMMVSYSLLTIKTASLLWFIHGSLQGRFSTVGNPMRRLQARSHGLRQSTTYPMR